MRTAGKREHALVDPVQLLWILLVQAVQALRGKCLQGLGAAPVVR